MGTVSEKRCFIWGTGSLAKQFIRFYMTELERLDLYGYVDNNSEKWGKEFSQKLETARQIQSELSVCIHIRRGDYLSGQFKDRFLVCTDDYYRKAVARMKERLPGARYYVFSDSIGWVKENMEYIRELDPVYVVNSGE